MKETMWGDPEARQEKKIFKIGRRAAYSIGIGGGCWFMEYLYPRPEEADKLAALLGPVGWILIGYGILTFIIIFMKKEIAPVVDIVLFWLIVPSVVIYIIMNNSPGG